MAKRITDDPDNLAFDIIRSMAHDGYAVVGDRLMLVRGDETMICKCVEGHDTEVSVGTVGGNDWRSTYANETDTIARMWSR